MNNLKTLHICVNCGHRETEDHSGVSLALTNERDEFSKTLSVILKIVYIFEGDQCKKYELRLKPGEYHYLDIIGKIRDKV